MSAFRTVFVAIVAIAAAFPQGARALPGRITRLEAGTQFAHVDGLLDIVRNGSSDFLRSSTSGLLAGLSAGVSRRGAAAAGLTLDLRLTDVGFSGRLGALGGLSVRTRGVEFELMGEGGVHVLPVLADPVDFGVGARHEGSNTIARPYAGARAALDWFRGPDERRFFGFWVGIRRDLGTWHAAFAKGEGPLGMPLQAFTVDSAAFEALFGFRTGFDLADE